MRHLYLYNVPGDFMGRIKAAKNVLLKGELVQPHTAVPGSPGRVLAYAAAPNFACDYVVVNQNTSDDGLLDAMAVALDMMDDPRMVTVERWLSKTLGAEVKEREDEMSEVQ